MLRLVEFSASTLRIARKRSTKFIRRTDSQFRKWRAIYARKRSGATFVAVTGSSGKTTTAALIAHILSGVASVRSQVGPMFIVPTCGRCSIPRTMDILSARPVLFGPGTLQPVLECGQTDGRRGHAGRTRAQERVPDGRGGCGREREVGRSASRKRIGCSQSRRSARGSHVSAHKGAERDVWADRRRLPSCRMSAARRQAIFA